MKCEICSDEKASIAKLSKHIRDAHPGVAVRAYYDTYLKREHEGTCTGCSKPTRYIGLGKGYKPACSKSCGVKRYREKQRNDPDRHAKFVAKVKTNQARIWADRNGADEGRRIREQIGSTISVACAAMTPEERSATYGWLNKLSPEDKAVAIEQILDKSLRKFYSEASSAVLEEIYRRRMLTKHERGIIQLNKDPEQWSEYCMLVWSQTEKNYRRHRRLINPLGHRRGHRCFHLDHKYSLFEGFKNGVAPEIIASVGNLEMLSSEDNLRKHSKCSITLEELLELWHGTLHQ